MEYHARSFLGAIVSYLNEDHPQAINREELRRLVDAWNKSGRSCADMEGYPELRSYWNGHLGYAPLEGSILPDEDGSGWMIAFSVRSPLLVDYYSGSPWPNPEDLAIDRARQVFVELLLNPEREKLSAKPCARCGCYYIKKTVRQKVYCSRKCGKDGTAAYATKQRLKAEHQDKLRVATEEARKWATAHTKEDWKRWVSKQAAGRREGLTPKFLTRAVNKGELTEPTKGER